MRTRFNSNLFLSLILMCFSTICFAGSSTHNIIYGSEILELSQEMADEILPDRKFKIFFIADNTFLDSDLEPIEQYLTNILFLLKNGSEDVDLKNFTRVTIHITKESIENYNKLPLGVPKKRIKTVYIDNEVSGIKNILRDVFFGVVGVVGGIFILATVF